ncbi:hypothetical protein SAMN04487905_10636 [Actinopolyspora xinjiangensis]|uniref:Uncharacterized protein n=1 Tax=Actinopolyspora xinjiangensis TaxID=405564 RepID=A0A1H0U4Q9_9ACTN|nr:hypothetical protein [Actinopolyspora xinjiangensis]SDP60958.1 hypothetical protein SAMN04487905_10636 [Actinopolyspora xinjiangensis]
MSATDLIDKWSSELQDASDILQPCRPKPFDNPCLEGMDQLGMMARSLEEDARQAGFTSLADAASEVERKTDRWLSECIYTKRNTPERVDCWADASGVIYGGGAGMLKGELYATTRTS